MTEPNAAQKRAITEIYFVVAGEKKVSLDDTLANFPKPSLLQEKVLAQIRRAVTKAAKSRELYRDLLSVLGSWGDTIEEKEVLSYLKEISRGGSPIIETFASIDD